jgi:inorganic pyrophosphatase
MKSSLPLLFTILASACVQNPSTDGADALVVRGPKHFQDGYPARASESTINVVVEIPAGTNAKWEVNKTDGSLTWEIKDGKPRVVQYLGYPANYGMVPRTILPKQLGGDGDPLDVLLLGPAVERGSVVEARLIGVLRLLDRGEQDDKLIAISVDAPLDQVSTLKELDANYNGITRILELWMSNYKGPGKMKSQGFADVDQARAILDAATLAYDEMQ